MFIKIDISSECDASDNKCRACVDACPVDIFRIADRRAVVVPENEDECTLCELCISACPANAISIVKLYEEAGVG